MPSTSIRLVFPNLDIDPEQVSRILNIESSHKKFEWELPAEEAQIVEELLLLWIERLEEGYPQLKSLCAEEIGWYLRVKVYEDDFYIEADLLARLGAIGVGVSVWFKPPVEVAWKEPAHATTITISEPIFFNCQLDEDHFFRWLQEIEGVQEVRGRSTDLIVYLSVPELAKLALIDLIGLLQRYDVPMSILRTQLTPANKNWLKSSQKYWYQGIYGDMEEA